MLDAAAGLTRVEAENAFSLSLVRHGRLAPDVLWELKAQTLKKSGLLTLHRGGETFADLGGLEALKAFCTRALRPGRPARRPGPGRAPARRPGHGQERLLQGPGQRDGPADADPRRRRADGLARRARPRQRIRQALRIVDAMAPCVVFIDEVEKALAGVAGQRPDRQRRLGPAVRHAADLAQRPRERRLRRLHGQRHLEAAAGVQPGRAVRRDLLPRPARRRGRRSRSGGCTWSGSGSTRPSGGPSDRDWTGAEIQACCRLAALLDVPLVEAAQNIVPVAVTAGESVERLRSWAAGRCLSADRPGIYTRGTDAARQARPQRPPRRPLGELTPARPTATGSQPAQETMSPRRADRLAHLLTIEHPWRLACSIDSRDSPSSSSAWSGPP